MPTASMELLVLECVLIKKCAAIASGTFASCNLPSGFRTATQRHPGLLLKPQRGAVTETTPTTKTPLGPSAPAPLRPIMEAAPWPYAL